MLACTSNRTNMSFLRICWPTFLDFLRNVGHYFFSLCSCPKQTGPTCWSADVDRNVVRFAPAFIIVNRNLNHQIDKYLP